MNLPAFCTLRGIAFFKRIGRLAQDSNIGKRGGDVARAEAQAASAESGIQGVKDRHFERGVSQ